MHGQAAAKINLFLKVRDRRPDGYHSLETVYQSVALADELEFSRTPEGTALACDDPALPADERNLVVRAVDLLRRRCPDRVGGLRIELRKRIPVGGGLGGGSADAAATLRACNAIFGLDLRAEELRALGAHLGMDVPFLIEGGRAMGTERGDRLAPLAMREEAWAVIAAPAGLAISTRWAYEALDRVAPREGPAFGDFVEALQTRPIEEWAPLCYNSFETAVFPAYSQLMEICNRLRELGCAGAFLTGSGAAVVGVTGESGIARAVAEKMKGRSMRVEAAPFLAARPV